jgi:hypothetical protein
MGLGSIGRILLGTIAVSCVAVEAALSQDISVPYSFSNGQVADANQVNANFDALVEAVDGVDARVDSLENSGTSGPFALGSELSYEPTVVSPGTKIQFSAPGTVVWDFLVAKFPITEFGSSTAYTITLPYNTTPYGAGMYPISLTTVHELDQARLECLATEIEVPFGSHTACITPALNRNWLGFDYPSSADFLEVRQRATVNLRIIIGQTAVLWTLTMSEQEYSIAANNSFSGTYTVERVDPSFNLRELRWDFSDTVQTDLMNQEPADYWFDAFDELLDYIVVEQMPAT